jgi:hypothetical protein
MRSKKRDASQRALRRNRKKNDLSVGKSEERRRRMEDRTKLCAQGISKSTFTGKRAGQKGG